MPAFAVHYNGIIFGAVGYRKLWPTQQLKLGNHE